jgi:cell division transport system permease protein
MLFARSDLPLERDPAGRFLPWIVGFMVYLAALALAGSLIAEELVQRWRSDLAGAVTVQVLPGPEGETAAERQARVEAAVNFLSVLPGIAAAKAVARDEVVRLLDPWLGRDNIGPDLPLPDLIAVTLVRGAAVDLDGLKAHLEAAVPGAVLEDHKPWLSDLGRLARAIEGLAAITVLLVAAASVLTIVFVSRSAFAQHEEVIEVLSLIGARDSYIAGQLQAYALRLAVVGAVIGVTMAVLTLLAAAALIGGGETQLMPAIGHLSWKWLLLVLPVPIAGAIALVTTRATVLAQLRRFA